MLERKILRDRAAGRRVVTRFARTIERHRQLMPGTGVA
jgi:hypothetical protein